jgi:tetratricopeptide (TPR) repeat protein
MAISLRFQKIMSYSQISEKIGEILENAKQLESIGRYEEAVGFLSPVWKNLNELPNTNGLNAEEQAELYLRCGSLAGYIGSCKQTGNSQELAKNLITEARELFLSLGIKAKIAECEIYLAVAYLRIGETEEARVWLTSSFSHNFDETDEIRLYSHVLEGFALLAENDFAKLVEKYSQIEKHFRVSSNYVLQGDFNNNYAVALMRLGEKEKSIDRFGLAKFFYEKIGHHLYLGLLENNLAGFFQLDERYEDAHKSIISARKTFQVLGDKTREGYSIDTQANIFMVEGKYKEALDCSNEAISLLESGENYCYLANSMQTKSHIEFHLEDYTNSLQTMVASVNIASLHISQAQATKFYDAYSELIKSLETK